MSWFQSCRKSNTAGSRDKAKQLAIESLELRRLMVGDISLSDGVVNIHGPTADDTATVSVERTTTDPCGGLGSAIDLGDDKPTLQTPDSYDPHADPDCGPSQAPPEGMVPAFDSNPGARHTLFLDFDGHYEQYWLTHADITTPFYDSDGIANITDIEALEIEEIFRRVAEDFAPFDVNVTTVDPTPGAGSLTVDTPNTGRVLRVAIGGSRDDWLDPEGNAVGVAKVNAYNSLLKDNLVYVFSDHLFDPADVAFAISHETGHAYGLRHLEVSHPSGRNAIMADTLPFVLAPRSIWWHGTNSKGKSQDDIAELGDVLGKRADDVGDSVEAATPKYGTGFLGRHVIGTTSDRDFFSFDVTHRSEVAVRAEVLSLGGVAGDGTNLDAEVELFSPTGVSLVFANTASSTDLSAEVTMTLNPGTYFVAVGSAGAYGDVGQYSLNTKTTPVSPIDLQQGTLTIHGTMLADDVVLSLSQDGDVVVDFTQTSVDSTSSLLASDSRADPPQTAEPYTWQETYPRSAVTDILFRGYHGDDEFRNLTPISATAYGDAGADYLVGGHADDKLYGGAGDDRLHGSGGDDTLVGEAGDDRLFGGGGHDLLLGDHQFVKLLGQLAGDDYLDGGAGDDTLRGSGGNDSLFGRGGVDDLDAGAGNDFLDGGHDNQRDTLRGGTGADRFVQHYERRYLFNLRTRSINIVWIAEDPLVDFSTDEYDTKINQYW